MRFLQVVSGTVERVLQLSRSYHPWLVCCGCRDGGPERGHGRLSTYFVLQRPDCAVVLRKLSRALISANVPAQENVISWRFSLERLWRRPRFPPFLTR